MSPRPSLLRLCCSRSILALLLTLVLSSVAWSQQIPCPVTTALSNSGAAINALSPCNVNAPLTNNSGASLENQTGATLNNNNKLTNNTGGTITNDTGATFNNKSGATLLNFG